MKNFLVYVLWNLPMLIVKVIQKISMRINLKGTALLHELIQKKQELN